MVGPRPGDGLRNLAIGLRGSGLIQNKGPDHRELSLQVGLGWLGGRHTWVVLVPAHVKRDLEQPGLRAGRTLGSTPLGYLLAATIHRLERTKPLLSRVLDISTMLPFALSAAMVGLGVLIGVIRLNPQSLYQFWPLPSLAHVMLTTPFVVRIILPRCALTTRDTRRTPWCWAWGRMRGSSRSSCP